MNIHTALEWLFGSLTLTHKYCLADGVFVFRWDKKSDINEPTQKAIVFHDGAREDLILQVRYEGPAEDFGWLVPVPGLPEVREGSMECFYELSRLTQERTGNYAMALGMDGGMDEASQVEVIEIKTVGAYEVAILEAGNAAALTAWLKANHFVFPTDKQNVLDAYIKKRWYFVAARIDPTQNGFTLQQDSGSHPGLKRMMSALTRQQLANGELHPLVISFDSEKCIFPLAISAVNGTPSEVSLYVLSAEPLMNGFIYDKQARELRQTTEESMLGFRRMAEAARRGVAGHRKRPTRHLGLDNDPSDPAPCETEDLGDDVRSFGDDEWEYPGQQVVRFWQVNTEDLPACAKQLPRLAGRFWWLTKQAADFAPEEMHDLEFNPAIPILSDKLNGVGCKDAAHSLRQLGAVAVPLLTAAAKSSDSAKRKAAVSAMVEMRLPGLTEPICVLLTDPDAAIRVKACYAAGTNWDEALAPRLIRMLGDSDPRVRSAAGFIVGTHWNDSYDPLFQQVLQEDVPTVIEAAKFFNVRRLPRPEIVSLFKSKRLPVVARAFNALRHTLTLEEVAPLLASTIPRVRLMGLGALAEISDKSALDHMIVMMQDTHEYVRWMARRWFRHATGQRLGSDRGAYEKWWTENKESFTPPAPSNRQFDRRPR